MLFKLFVLMLVCEISVQREIMTNGEQKRNKKIGFQNVYVYNHEMQNFVTIFNVSLSTPKLDVNSLQKTIRILADNMPPTVIYNQNSRHLDGYLGEIWNIITDTFSFNTNLSLTSYVDGVNSLELGKAEIFLASGVVNENLINIYYSQPYFYNWYHLYIKQPEAKASSSSYFKTFNGKLWWGTLGLFLTLTLSLWLTIKFLNRLCRLEPNISIPTCFLSVISGFINQGFDLKLMSYSGRIQMMFALILGVILYSAMNAVLVAQLAVLDIPFPFKSLENIAQVRTHSLCVRTNSFVYNNFTDTEKNIYPRWKTILNGKGCLNINSQDNLAKILCNDNIIVLENRVVMATVIKNYKLPCNIINLKAKYFGKNNSFLMVKSFKLKRLIDNFIKKLKCVGILKRLQDKWINGQKLDVLNFPSTLQVTMDHIDGIIYMYIFLVWISFFILCIEIGWDHYVKVKSHKNFAK